MPLKDLLPMPLRGTAEELEDMPLNTVVEEYPDAVSDNEIHKTYGDDPENPTAAMPSAGAASSVFDWLAPSEGGMSADAQVLKELFSADNILMKTDVPDSAIPILAFSLTQAIKYRSKPLWDYITTYLRLRISKDRKGREEMVAISLRRKGISEREDWD